MTAPSATPTPITPPRVPFFDERSGLISREWYMFFLGLFRQASNTYDSLTTPPTTDMSGVLDQTLQAAQLAAQTSAEMQDFAQTAQLAALIAAAQDSSQVVDLAAQLTAAQANIATLQSSVQGLELAPPRREFKRSRWGSFYDTTTQTAAAINTAYAMTFNTTDLSSGVRLRSGSSSQVEIDTEGVYDIQFSAQLGNTSGGNHLAFIWLRVNGSNVANSASQVRLKGSDGELVAAWNFFYQFKANDYFELMWSVTDTGVQIASIAAAAPVPAIPSVILTVSNNIQGVQ